MRRVLVLSFLVMAFSFMARAQDAAKKIDDFIAVEMARQMIPGVSLAVIKRGKPLLVKSYGFSNLEHRVPVKPETIFQSGSVGKQFTAMAVMMLIEDGKINLEDRIGKYLGEVPESWRNITVRNLLSHTAGMTDYAPGFDFRRDYSEEDLLKIVKEVPLAFAPGERWEYSNLGYVTLGILIGRVTGKFYGHFLQERVFKPAGMTTARIISEADIVPNRASGYRVVNGDMKNQNWVSPSMNTTADGSLYLSILDMIRWDQALTDRKLLRPASYDSIWTPVKLTSGKTTTYGFGWAIKSVNGRRLIEHGGSWQGFRSFIARYIDDEVSVIVLANSSNANPQRIAHTVAGIVSPPLKPQPAAEVEIGVSGEMRRLFESVLKGKPEPNRFSAPVQTSLSGSEDRLLNHLKTLGPILEFELTEREKLPDAVAYTYEVQFGSMTIALNIVRDSDGLISRFEIHPE